MVCAIGWLVVGLGTLGLLALLYCWYLGLFSWGG